MPRHLQHYPVQLDLIATSRTTIVHLMANTNTKDQDVLRFSGQSTWTRSTGRLLYRHRVAASFLPIDLLQMIQLTELSLSRCGLLDVPVTLYELSCLERLSIKQCQGVHFAQKAYIPSTIAAHHMKSLTLAFCDIYSLPLPVLLASVLEAACSHVEWKHSFLWRLSYSVYM